jgi:hypothetical protein
MVLLVQQLHLLILAILGYWQFVKQRLLLLKRLLLQMVLQQR